MQLTLVSTDYKKERNCNSGCSSCDAPAIITLGDCLNELGGYKKYETTLPVWTSISEDV